MSRHEPAWILDTLARDLPGESIDPPGGGAYVGGRDPNWWDRQPGW